MKNIHVLPTDKPSRLFKDDFGKYFISINIDQEQNHFKPQHIYITSDEEIKEGDCVLYHEDKISQVLGINIDELKLDKGGVWRSSCKKIILTTDQDLIKDGVQSIDDEFLEWFIKNPSCEGGAKWQAERMYSEEDIREAYFSAIKITGEGWNGEYAGGNSPNIEDKFSEEFKEWFEQFKKNGGDKC